MKMHSTPLWLSLVIIAVAVFIAYGGTLDDEFHFDDMQGIKTNLYIKKLSAPLDTNLISGIMSGQRWVTDFTFALNYYFGRLDTKGYHLLSIVLHIVASFLVFFLVRRLCISAEKPVLDNASFLPLFAASVFGLHPINTQAVSYLSQRAEILSVLFYLASLLLFVKSLQNENRIAGILFYLCGTASFILALGSKLTAITLPAILLLYDYFFMKRRSIRRNVISYGPMVLCGSVIAVLFLLRLEKSPDVGFSIPGLTSFQYLMTQMRVVVTYIRLLFLPVNQNLDYDYPASSGLFEPAVFISFMIVLIIIVVSLKMARGRKVAAFGVLWFFITLAPTSSIVPVTDLIFEHRLYMPSIGFAIFLTAVLSEGFKRAEKIPETYWLTRIIVVCVIVFMVSLVSASINRNRVWESKVALWSDVVNKSPEKVRPYLNLGNAFHTIGRDQEAIAVLIRGAGLASDRSAGKQEIFRELGVALHRQGRLEEALLVYLDGLKYDPTDAGLLHNIAIYYLDINDDILAKEYVERALQAEPAFGEALNTLGSIYLRKGDFESAARYFLKAIAADPDVPIRYRNAAISFGQLGRRDEAEANFMKYLQIEPDPAKKEEVRQYLRQLKGAR